MMVLYGKKTWWMLRPEILDATPSTVESGHDNERIDVMQSTPVDCNHCAISQDLQCCAKGCLATNAFHVQ